MKAGFTPRIFFKAAETKQSALSFLSDVQRKRRTVDPTMMHITTQPIRNAKRETDDATAHLVYSDLTVNVKIQSACNSEANQKAHGDVLALLPKVVRSA